MKIVEVLIYLSGGGAQRFTADLCNELSKEHDVTLLTILDENKNPEDRQFGKAFLNKDVRYINLGQKNGFHLAGQLQVYKVLKKLNPDIIHINGKPLTSFMFLSLFLSMGRWKLFETIHNDLPDGYTSGLQKIKFNTIGRWKWMKFAALSEKNYKDILRTYPYCISRCIVNGRAPINATDAFEEVKNELATYRKDSNTKLFIHVARYAPVKNQGMLIDAFNQLVEEGRNISMIVLGLKFDWDEGKKIVDKACSSIHFLGGKVNVSDYLLNSDIFILSSLSEGMPITLLEASLAGVPAVTTPVGGCIELVKDGVNGIKSKEITCESLKQAMMYAIDNYNTLKTGAMSLKDSSPYTIKECARKYVEFFKE